MTAASSDFSPAPARVAVLADAVEARAAASTLAHRAGLALITAERSAGFDFLIRVSTDTVFIEPLQAGFGGPVAVDWLTPDVRRRVRGGRRQPLARAVGLHRRNELSVLDATAGFGRDGFVLAALGARTTSCERNPLMHALLQAAWSHARRDPWAALAAGRLRLAHADADDYLRAAGAPFDTVYLDPMYSHRRKKTALPKKEMRVLRALVGDDHDAPTLLHAALQHAAARVVVKRPPAAPPLAGLAPDFAFKGKQARYDVYLTASGDGRSSGARRDRQERREPR